MKILSSYSILAFQFDIHPMLLTLQIDMQEKDKVGWASFCGIASKYNTFMLLFPLFITYNKSSKMKQLKLPWSSR